MVELRRPPVDEGQTAPSHSVLPVVQTALLVAILVALVFVVARGSGREDGGSDPERLRELASRLKASGALDESAMLMERYAERAAIEPGARATIAYGLGQTYLERGRPERALRWFYDAEEHADGALREEVARKIVHSLERMGRHHAAQAALDSRVKLEPADAVRRPETDPVVARVGEREILRSEIERALDEIGAPAGDREQRREFLRRFVADELLYRKARKLEYDRDPDVSRALSRVAQQLVISKFVEKEVLSGIQVEDSDLENFFAANRKRYVGEEPSDRPITLAEARPAVERDYLQSKAQAAYQQLIDRELESAAVELFPERLEEGSNG